MSQIFFRLLLLLAQLIRGPISVFLIVLKNFIPALKKRIDFERKNFLEDECRSFKKDGLKADFSFEVSSEGELEQVRPLLEAFLKENKRLEILFASPSVETKCLRLARENPDQIRVFRVPLATHFFLFQTAAQFLTASRLIFCRYDFFPELLILKFFKMKFILLSGAAGKKPSWFKSEVYKLFDVIVAANDREAQVFLTREHLDKQKIMSFDFRIPRIFERADKSARVLENTPELKNYLEFLKSGQRNKRLVLGSAWESDFAIFSDPLWRRDLISNELHLLVVPHHLKEDSVASMKSSLRALFPDVPVYEISKKGSDWTTERPGIVVLNMSGVLCELYTQFDLVYVGGGFGRSIHSVLEPFLSGAKVFCGPRVHRSTEYDFVEETAPNEIQLLKNGDSFYTLFKDKAATPPLQSLRDELRRSAVEKMKTVIHEIEAC